MSVLGRFLEFSVRTQDIVESLSFYKALGFTELPIGDAWPHKYAVLSDGELYIGLHDREFQSPALAFVHPDLARYARSMSDHGLDFSRLRLDEDVFNELAFADLDGHTVSMLEARTFSPPVDDLPRSLCGEWFETVLPVKDTVQSGRFWAPLAPVLLRLREEPTTHMRFDAEGLLLGLSESIALKQPSLCFKGADSEALFARLAQHSFAAREYPGFEGASHEIVAPEGTRLYLFEQDFLGETYIVEESGQFEALP